MTQSDHKKVYKQLKQKPVKLKKFIKHNAPKKRASGFKLKNCRICGRSRGFIGKYELNLCRQCFREIAGELGFKKFA